MTAGHEARPRRAGRLGCLPRVARPRLGSPRRHRTRVRRGAELDAFFAAFRIPDLIFQLVAAGALSSALVPIVSAPARRATSEARAWRVVSTVINLMLVALAILAGVALPAGARGDRRTITPGFDDEQLGRTIQLTRIMLLSPIFLAMGAVATSVLNAGGRFAASAVAPIVYNLAIIGGALILAPTLGVEGLALGRRGRLARPSRWSSCGPLRRLGFRYEPRIDRGGARSASGPRPDGPSRVRTRREPDHVHRRHGARHRPWPPAPSPTSTSPSRCSSCPIGVIGVPLGIVLLPTLARDAAVGREVEFAALGHAGAPAPAVRDDPARGSAGPRFASRSLASCLAAAGSVRRIWRASRRPWRGS